MSKNKLNLEALAQGGFSERVNQAIKEVMDNIADPNTDFKFKRKVNIEMTFTATKDRDVTNVDIVAKPKLAPKEGVHTTVLIDKNLDGEIIAAEYRKQISGQQAMKVDSETGEVIDPVPEDTKGLQIVR